MTEQQTVVSLGADGRLLIPAVFRQAADLTEGDRFILTATDDRHALSLEKVDDHISAAEGLFQSYAPEQGSIVDELIAERRQEAAKE